ncbi:MAG: hypothetical protein HYZ73_01125 [Elusimicrobia bacterium]|nr:hypothetical protein [Elusimicrobiota bacterium]
MAPRTPPETMLGKRSLGGRAGYTVTELLLTLAVLTIVTLPVVSFFQKNMGAVFQTDLRRKAEETARNTLDQIEANLMEANEVTIASATLVEFICDWNKHPNYNPWALSVNGIPNIMDPDVDGDANTIVTDPTTQWRYGYNLKDDDDNGDGRIDVRFRYYWVGRTLSQDASYDEEPWGNHVKVVATNILNCTFTYFGNKNLDLGRQLDLGHDGIAGTGDVGENDGIIDQIEMDMVPPPAGAGNRNGQLDLRDERKYITSIHIVLQVDINNDGVADYTLETELAPPLMPLKWM